MAFSVFPRISIRGFIEGVLEHAAHDARSEFPRISIRGFIEGVRLCLYSAPSLYFREFLFAALLKAWVPSSSRPSSEGFPRISIRGFIEGRRESPRRQGALRFPRISIRGFIEGRMH